MDHNHLHEQKLHHYLTMIACLNESTEEFFYLWDFQTLRCYISKEINHKYDLFEERKEWYDQEDWRRIIYKRDVPPVREKLKKIQKGESTIYDADYRILDRNGKTIWINCKGRCLSGFESGGTYLVGKIAEKEIGKKTDYLTGLLTTDKFLEDLEKWINKGIKGYLILFDVDNMKNINMKCGRSYGNSLLKKVAEVLEEAVNDYFRIYRMEGDQFIVILTEQNQEKAEEIFRQVQSKLQPICTISAGVVSYEKTEGHDADIFYQYGENALDLAKKEGKNRLVFFSSDNYNKRLSQIGFLDELKQSIQKEFQGFSIHYQAKVSSKTYDVCGAEALLRYDSMERGFVSPTEFIPLLEQSESICIVGEWVLENALRACKEWRKQLPDFCMSVNVSYVQLMEKDVVRMVIDKLEKIGLPGSALILEVTESMQLQDYEYFNNIFSQWRSYGIQISIDDFGTGYSSLSYLKSIEVDEVKIDRCFIRQIQFSDYNYRLFHNTIDLAHSANIMVCCEGVEKEEELSVIEELSPDTLQGFLFAKPCSADQFTMDYVREKHKNCHAQIGKEKYLQQIELENQRKVSEFLDKKRVLNNNSRKILEATQMGLWVIRMDKKEGHYELIVDDTMFDLLGLEETPTPEECYAHWYSRINDGYYHYVNLAVDNMIQSREIVQLEYSWNHPQKGDVVVRCVGTCRQDDGGKICLVGYHRLINEIEKPRFLPDTYQSEMFEFNEKRKAIFFHTDRSFLFGEKKSEDHFPDCWIESEMVHPHYAEHFANMFSEVEKQEELSGQEMLLKSKKGTYEWFHIKTRHLGKAQQDIHTIVAIIEPANQERAMELEYIRTSDFYQAVLSDAAAYAEVDVESGHVNKTGGLWSKYSCGENAAGNFTKTLEKNVDQVVFQDDREEYREYLNLDNMKEFYQQGIHTRKFCFRRIMDNGQLCWMNLSVHIFQERFSKNMYALLYLDNVDAEKKLEIAREIAANRDPLTDVYNRRTFEEEVRKYMDGEEDACGYLLLLDLDDFKSINDQFGHAEGDHVLKRLTEILLSIFRRKDIIGRYGGDEFLVFVKSVRKKEILEKRLQEMFLALQESSHTPFTCSVGIVFIEKQEFSYEENLKKADIALYESKQKGKNRYAYYEREK